MASETEAFRLEIPPRSTSIALARLFAGSIARHFGCDDEMIEDVKIAISEIVTNAVKAHQGIASFESVLLQANVVDSTITFEVVDRGPGFDVETVARPPQPAVLSRGSLGLALVRSLFPSTLLRRNDESGMTVGFSLSFNGAPAR